MTVTRVIRYRTKPDRAEDNERLIRDVFAELAATDPGGLWYAAFRLDDGVTFVHLAQTADGENPLATSAAFARFQSDIGDRCDDGPVPAEATVIGDHGLLRG
jgi:hypothetical protein